MGKNNIRAGIAKSDQNLINIYQETYILHDELPQEKKKLIP